MSVSMLVPFTLIVLKRALAIAGAKGLAFCAVKFDCGCGAGEVLICHKLVENGLQILLSCWLVSKSSGRLCGRFSLLQDRNACQAPREGTQPATANSPDLG
jgi:hypothetical protein